MSLPVAVLAKEMLKLLSDPARRDVIADACHYYVASARMLWYEYEHAFQLLPMYRPRAPSELDKCDRGSLSSAVGRTPYCKGVICLVSLWQL